MSGCSRHYHGAIEAKAEHLDNYKGKQGYFIKKFLISDKFNANRWRVTWEAILQDVKSFVGKPLVLTPDMDHPPTRIQDDYRVGTIIDVGLDEDLHTAWQVSEIHDKKVFEKIKSKEIRYGSPTVQSPQSLVELRNRGTAAEETIMHRFRGMHDALVAEPAYGKIIDTIPAVCEGDGVGCATKLLEVQADINDNSIQQITIVPFVQRILKRRFKASTLASVVNNANSDDSCVSKKIRIIKSESPDMPDDQAVAIAISYCKEGQYSARIEDTLLNDVSKIIFR